MIDIVIPTYGQENFTAKCVESIRRFTSCPYRIVWVDNGSSAISREVVLKSLEGCDYLSIWIQHNLGFVKAVNAGLKECHGEYIVLQNNDTEVTKGWIERLLKPHSDPTVGATGPMTDTEGSWQGWLNVKTKLYPQLPNVSSLPKDQISDEVFKAMGDTARSMNMVAFFSTVFKKEVFDKVGLLDEQFGTGLGDDDDYSKRMIDAGYKVMFVPGAFVHHHHRTTFKSVYNDSEIADMQRVNLSKFKTKHGLK